MSKYYWQLHCRAMVGNRLAWFAEPADDAFWHNYWDQKITPAYYQSAGRTDLNADPIGRILLNELDTEGYHLEAGCGAGYWVAALTEQYRVIGIEYSQRLVDRVNEVAPNLCVEFGDALNLKYTGNSFDTYLSFGVVEHRFEGPEPFLSEAFRILKPGGKIIISVPVLGPVRQLKNRLRRYQDACAEVEFFQYGFSRRDFISLIHKSGFAVKYTKYIQIHRMLLEEFTAYRCLADSRIGGFLQQATTKLLSRFDGHMILIVAIKSNL